METKHVVVLTTWYPTRMHPARCTFTEEIVKAQSALRDLKVTVVVPTPLHELLLALPSRVFGPIGLQPRPRTYTVERPVFFKLPGTGIRLYAPFYSAAVRRTLRRIERPDLLHVHGLLPNGYIGARIAAQIGVPCVMHVHESGLLDARKRSLYRRILHRADKIIAVSKSTRQKISELEPALSTKCSVVYNGVSVAKFQRVVPLHERRMRILFVGNLLPVKGLPVLLSALTVLRDRYHREVQLDIVGDGPERKRYARLAQSLRVSTRFLGVMDNRRVRGLMREYRALVLPSYYETFGVVLVEALQSGVPVVASNVGAIPEIVRDGIDGLLVDSGNAEILANAIAVLLDSEWDLLRIIRRGRQFSIAKTAASIFALYEQSLGPINEKSVRAAGWGVH